MAERNREQVYGHYYTWLLPSLQKIAREHGYALGIHGSFHTDMDLICAPWVEEASDAETLVNAIKDRVKGYFKESDFAAWKPHRRIAWTIYFNEGCFGPYLDISVLPREQDNGLDKATNAAIAEMEKGKNQ